MGIDDQDQLGSIATTESMQGLREAIPAVGLHVPNAYPIVMPALEPGYVEMRREPGSGVRFNQGSF